jgi:folylpolyglutamate synthase/dihydropteroate synthase
VTLIFGASSDKDVTGMLSALLQAGSGIRRVLLTQAVHPRAQEPEAMAGLVAAHGVRAEMAPTVAQAVEEAWRTAEADEVVLATGSLFIVAEARAAAETRLPIGGNRQSSL